VLGRDLFAGLDSVRPSGLPPNSPIPLEAPADHLSLREARRVVEREYLIRLIARFGSDLDAAARHAGLHRKSLVRLLRQHSLGKSLADPLFGR